MHLVPLSAPFILEYVPGGQFVHTFRDDAPLTAENLPGTQLMHTVTDAAPTCPENLPAAQRLQAVAPVTNMYLPTLQGAQLGLPSPPENVPVLHGEQEDEQAMEYLPGRAVPRQAAHDH
jgi:hypothetical protein